MLSDTLDLHHRYPHLWRQVETLRVPAWKAARITQLTHRLGREAAKWIDDRLHVLGRYGWPTIEATIKQAIAMFHPELLKREDGLAGREDWDVTLDHAAGIGGTSRLEATGDSLDLTKFHHLVCDEATTLGRLGDTDTLGQRKAKALGVLADRQATLDLESVTGSPSRTQPGADAEPGPTAGAGESSDTGAGLVRRSYLKTRLFLHLTLADLTAHQTGDTTRVGDAGVLGPQLVAQIEAWLAECGSDAQVTPVIDLNRDWAVDRHDPPPAMREQVILRDQHCVYPYCTRDARACDLDHIESYDPDGPAGQTSPDQLAALCRGHHRLKTFTGWCYRREPDGSYTWTSPYGERWRVAPGEGTIRLPDNAGGGGSPGLDGRTRWRSPCSTTEHEPSPSAGHDPDPPDTRQPSRP